MDLVNYVVEKVVGEIWAKIIISITIIMLFNKNVL